MQGTLLCAVTDGAENDDAIVQAADVSRRLGLRLVLAHVAGGIAPPGDGDADRESVTMKADRQAAERRLAALARRHGVEESADRRVAIGDPATLLGRIAGEEAAGLIVVGARRRGWGRRAVECRLAQELETETAVPVLIAPPRERRATEQPAANGTPR